MSFECSCKKFKLHSSIEPKPCMGCSLCDTAYARKGSNHIVKEEHTFKQVEQVLKCTVCDYIDPISYRPSNPIRKA